MTPETLPDVAPCLSGQDGAVILAVRAQPGAKRCAVLGMHGERLRVAVQAPPVDGKANEALVAYVADLLGLPRRAVAVVAGLTSRDKRLAIDAPRATVLAGVTAALTPHAANSQAT